MNADSDVIALPLMQEGEGLEGLAERINREHRACERKAAESVEHARRAGEMLIEAKSRVPYGEWGHWIQEQCDFSHSTANLYMRIARDWGQLPESVRVRNLPLRQLKRVVYGTEKPDPVPAASAEPRHPDGVLIGREAVVTRLRRVTVNGRIDLALFSRAFAAVSVSKDEHVAVEAPEIPGVSSPFGGWTRTSKLTSFVRQLEAMENDTVEVRVAGDALVTEGRLGEGLAELVAPAEPDSDGEEIAGQLTAVLTSASAEAADRAFLVGPNSLRQVRSILRWIDRIRGVDLTSSETGIELRVVGTAGQQSIRPLAPPGEAVQPFHLKLSPGFLDVLASLEGGAEVFPGPVTVVVSDDGWRYAIAAFGSDPE